MTTQSLHNVHNVQYDDHKFQSTQPDVQWQKTSVTYCQVTPGRAARQKTAIRDRICLNPMNNIQIATSFRQNLRQKQQKSLLLTIRSTSTAYPHTKNGVLSHAEYLYSGIITAQKA